LPYIGNSLTNIVQPWGMKVQTDPLPENDALLRPDIPPGKPL
jgi:hypothetical protein